MLKLFSRFGFRTVSRRRGGQGWIRHCASRTHCRRKHPEPARGADPSILVDCVVVADAENHAQTYGTAYSHAFSGRQRVPMNRIAPLELDERKVIARRCAFELPPGGVVNLGIGMPEGIAAVAAEEHVLQHLTLTAEPGIIGGMPQGG
jgi:propionate CoA-transferase